MGNQKDGAKDVQNYIHRIPWICLPDQPDKIYHGLYGGKRSPIKRSTAHLLHDSILLLCEDHEKCGPSTSTGSIKSPEPPTVNPWCRADDGRTSNHRAAHHDFLPWMPLGTMAVTLIVNSAYGSTLDSSGLWREELVVCPFLLTGRTSQLRSGGRYLWCLLLLMRSTMLIFDGAHLICLNLSTAYHLAYQCVVKSAIKKPLQKDGCSWHLEKLGFKNRSEKYKNCRHHKNVAQKVADKNRSCTKSASVKNSRAKNRI